MKVLEKNLKKGFVKVVPESADDFWHLYNIICENDEVYAYTTREIKPDGKYERPKRGQRVSVFLGVRVESIDWDRLFERLRIRGLICSGLDDVPSGAHHALSISLHTPLTIVKEEWSKHQLDRLERARRTSEKSIIIISIDDEGYAIATTAQFGIQVRAEERTRLPGKLENEKRSEAKNEYFKKAANSLRQVWEAKHDPIAIVGVGFIKNDFAQFIRREEREIPASIMDVKSVNNGGMSGIYEAIRSGVLLNTMKHLRIIQETEVIEEALKRLGKNEANVTYGLDQVEDATKLGAIEKLAIAEAFLRDSEDKTRLKIEAIMKDVEQKRGQIMVISGEHESGAKLLALGGVLALLRFPLSSSR